VPRVTESRRGAAWGVAAYLLWGLFPLYWPLLEPAGAVEILSHRVVWSLVVVVALLAALGGLRRVRRLGARRLGLLAVAAAVVSVNWGVYIYGVNTGQVVETSLGYFVNPLVTVALGVLVLGERLRSVQWVAIALATLAVVGLAVDYGRPPWIALALAFSFAVYGLLKKLAAVGAVESLAVETAVLTPFALAYLAVLGATGAGTFTLQGPGHAALLVGGGLVTAVPLLCFGAAATRVPLSTLGLLQYLAPSLQFAIGVLVVGEPLPPARLAGFVVVWVALALFTADALGHRRRQLRIAVPEPV
jgi:chloramphenicol-sensitive protein RarD